MKYWFPVVLLFPCFFTKCQKGGGQLVQPGRFEIGDYIVSITSTEKFIPTLVDACYGFAIYTLFPTTTEFDQRIKIGTLYRLLRGKKLGQDQTRYFVERLLRLAGATYHFENHWEPCMHGQSVKFFENIDINGKGVKITFSPFFLDYFRSRSECAVSFDESVFSKQDYAEIVLGLLGRALSCGHLSNLREIHIEDVFNHCFYHSKIFSSDSGGMFRSNKSTHLKYFEAVLARFNAGVYDVFSNQKEGSPSPQVKSLTRLALWQRSTSAIAVSLKDEPLKEVDDLQPIIWDCIIPLCRQVWGEIPNEVLAIREATISQRNDNEGRPVRVDFFCSALGFPVILIECGVLGKNDERFLKQARDHPVFIKAYGLAPPEKRTVIKMCCQDGNVEILSSDSQKFINIIPDLNKTPIDYVCIAQKPSNYLMKNLLKLNGVISNTRYHLFELESWRRGEVILCTVRPVDLFTEVGKLHMAN